MGMCLEIQASITVGWTTFLIKMVGIKIKKNMQTIIFCKSTINYCNKIKWTTLKIVIVE